MFRLFVFLVILVPAAARAGQITPAMLDRLPPADIVVLGEVHDNPVHHRNQARAVRAIQPRALVFEMLVPAQLPAITPDRRLDRQALARALNWKKSGWPDFAMYFPIFEAAPKARIYAGNLPRKQIRKAIFDGAAGVFGTGANRFGLDQPLPQPQNDQRLRGQREAHCNALPEGMLGGMVEAQRLRDASIARAAIRAFRETGGPVVVITGNGHARRDWGVPALIARAAPRLKVLSIGQLEQAPDGPPPYDLWLLTAPTQRDDPCAVFGKKTQ